MALRTIISQRTGRDFITKCENNDEDGLKKTVKFIEGHRVNLDPKIIKSIIKGRSKSLKKELEEYEKKEAQKLPRYWADWEDLTDEETDETLIERERQRIAHSMLEKATLILRTTIDGFCSSDSDDELPDK